MVGSCQRKFHCLVWWYQYGTYYSSSATAGADASKGNALQSSPRKYCLGSELIKSEDFARVVARCGLAANQPTTGVILPISGLR